MTRWLAAVTTAIALFSVLPAWAAECGKGGQGPVTIYYDTGKTALTADHKRKLSQFAETAKHRSWVCVFAQVDAQGSKEANARVSEARAQNVKRFLVANGVAPDRVLIAKQEKGTTLFGLLGDDQKSDRRVTVTYE